MNIKNIKAVFFLLIFLSSKVGLALNVHYCGGHIAEIALAWNAEDCGMSSEKSHETHQGFVVEKNHCCQDEALFIQNNEPQKTSESASQNLFFVTPQNKFDFSNAAEIQFPKPIFTRNRFLVPKNKIFLLHQSLVFYS